ncbi:mitochondrial putative cruciform cutting endonuclease 1 [Mollisia scopiformis]|uniref:Mitochondrial putative cruciform cutting endonuclease 1 n=1 Tax=Mollisia scopiformis TaxID=149040 RepID=A0A194WWH1_MOLSC|nr:mitochondrial putative cruciform cutting endonuclease 1 [Mollisia scopiformis]KUJ12029.1 mitochondrial putative cruciform cutting endonuclease 1 [Mollisia scopiformis]
MALQIPLTYKLAQLKHIAFKCGISTSGTKPILIQRLIDEITSTPRNASPHTRILSVDMGIRNLAYCVLDVPPTSRTKTASKKSLPSILEWHRLAVSSAPRQSADTDTPLEKEAFDPATLSSIAYKLLRERMLLEQPTQVLIERQRFRSGGSSHILEWTIRVNMFEAIIYAVLCTLEAEGLWKGEVKAIQPGKVGPFWVDEWKAEAGVGKKRSSLLAKTHNKGAKVDLVRRWLESGDVVVLGSESVQDMAKAYGEKWKRLPGRVKGKRKEVGESSQEKMGKLDDLADCLLQVMAWVQWEENKRIALKHGVEALLEE